MDAVAGAAMSGKRLWEIEHPYYCNEGNYFQAGQHYTHRTWQSFISAMGESDMDMNWFVRWDWREDEGSYTGDDYYRNGTLTLHMVGQRKAWFGSYEVDVCRADEASVIEFLKPRWDYMRTMWDPFSGQVSA